MSKVIQELEAELTELRARLEKVAVQLQNADTGDNAPAKPQEEPVPAHLRVAGTAPSVHVEKTPPADRK